jgi:hypothetical protein
VEVIVWMDSTNSSIWPYEQDSQLLKKETTMVKKKSKPKKKPCQKLCTLCGAKLASSNKGKVCHFHGFIDPGPKEI